MPLLAALAVALCTAMVLVVWSVMGGFLTLLLNSGKSMIGDVSITWPVRGIPHYERLIERLEKDPAVAAATPLVETIGLLGLPGGDTKTVQVLGVEPAGYDRVTGYFARLWWRPLEEPLPRDDKREDPRLTEPAMAKWLEAGKVLRRADLVTGAERPAVVLGIEVARPNNQRTEGGFIQPRWNYMPEEEVTLSVLPLSQRGVAIDTRALRFAVANEFRSGLYDVDANWVIVPLDSLQHMLRLDRAERVREGESARHGGVTRDPTGRESFAAPSVTEIEPARATTVLVKAADGVTANGLRERVAAIYREFAEAEGRGAPPPGAVPIFTWEKKPGLESFIAAVQKETALVLVLFAFISLTAVFLVFAIFWSMISEKTKDIGVLRAIGASRTGVAWLFVRYGLALGIVGSALGGVLAWLVVSNINPIHEWLGRALGIVVWDPSIYYFDQIPTDMELGKAAIVLATGVLSAAVGALIPAARAASMDPVRAIRFE